MDQSNNHSGVVNGWINDDWEQFGSLGEISTQAGMNKESQSHCAFRYKAAAFSDPLFQTIYALSPEVETVVVVEVGGEVGVLGQKNLHKITVSSNLIRICLMVPGSIVCNILLEISK
ncbi:hypothetical protein BY996DRAFT_6422802 [Phakopsora pachyrhizi]|nr:hypothetical protein BY996DRAFT_6422802 [Phakopsora pachyrhizi]